MHLELLVEEASAEAALAELLPKIVGSRATWRIHPHRGKSDLLAKLRGRLRGYARWIPEDWRIVVLIDEDRQDCHDLKHRLEAHAREAGLMTRSRRGANGRSQVINRLAVEEIEAWYFGDVEALRTAYPRLSARVGRQRSYSNPDAIRGGTWQALERELKTGGYFRSGLAKIELARAVAKHMDPGRNRSRSFQVFRDALAELVQ